MGGGLDRMKEGPQDSEEAALIREDRAEEKGVQERRII